jgi:hypothetical protein
VRTAYEQGETGPAVARRFDVGLSNLRKKARAEGWDRRSQAAAHDAALAPDPAPPAPDPVHPAAARDDAIRRAAALLAAGHAVEASALIKAAEALGRLAGDAPPPPDPAPSEQEAVDRAAAREAATREWWEELRHLIQQEADLLARRMIAGEWPGVAHNLFAQHWRAQVLGPEVAAVDLAEARKWSSHPRGYDAEGRLRPPGSDADWNWDYARPVLMQMWRTS